MASPTVRCPRCGFTPIDPASTLRAGSPCVQCGQPMAATAEEPAVRGAARPRGMEDRQASSRRRPPRGASPTKAVGRFILFATWVAIVFGVMGGSTSGPGLMLRKRLESLLQAVNRAPAGPPSMAFTPPADFRSLAGTWMGAPIGGSGIWTFQFAEPATVQITEEDGTVWSGQGRVYWERGDDGGLKVLEGGYPLDIALSRPGEGSASILLGSYRQKSGDWLELCLGRPGGLARTSEFQSTPEITCWSLIRSGL